MLTTQAGLVSVGGRILRTMDGGVTWTVVRQGSIGSQDYVRHLQWVGQSAYAASTQGLFRSGQLGVGWQQVSARTDLLRLDFLSQSLGYAIADPYPSGQGRTLVRTTDGGRSFVSVDTGLPAVQWVQFLSTSLGWVSGPSGIAVTYDGGARWSRQLSFPAGTFDGAQPPAPDFWKSQVGFRDSLHGFAYYHSVWTVMNQSAGVLYYTADGGGTWRGMTCTCGYIPIPDSALLGAKHGLPGAFVEGDLDVTGADSASFVQSEAIMDRTSVCTTYSAGSTWSCSYLPFAKSAPGRIASIGSTRWLVLREPGLDKAIIATSGDAGLSWVVRTTISE